MTNRTAFFIPSPYALVFIAVVLFLVAGGIFTVESASQNHSRVELISDEVRSNGGSELSVGVSFHLDQGWHIYWQNPGDSGEPPKIEWQLPPGYQAGPIEWPRPIRLGSGSVVDYGYENQVLLIAPLHSTEPAESRAGAPITADVKYVVCSQICVPAKAHLTLLVPSSAGRAEHPRWHHLFQETRAQFPKPTPADWNASAKWTRDVITLDVRGRVPPHDVTFFPLDPSVIDNAAPQQLLPLKGGLELQFQTSPQLLAAPAKLRGLIEFTDGNAYQIAVPVPAGPH